MEIVLNIAMLLLPATAVIIAVYFVMKQFMLNEQRKLNTEVKLKRSLELTPIRLQAFERIVLFLERISPSSVIVRVERKGKSARQYQDDLVKTIKAEFEHNLAQQIYVSSASWQIVKNAKDEMVKLVNIAAANVGPKASATDLSRLILEKTANIENMPTKVAIDYVKKEIRQVF